MNVQWAIGELQAVKRFTQMHRISGGFFHGTAGWSTAGSETEVSAAAPVVEQILDRVIPGWREDVPIRPHNRWTRHRAATLRAASVLKGREEIREKLGDDAPGHH